MSDEPDIIVVGGREQIFHLLAEASEIEHTLMCSYLYAAFSLKAGADHGLSDREAAAVLRWRQAILGVAIQEMVHLLLVANLSIAIGGHPHFGRPNFPVSAGYFPSGVVVKLAPFTAATLDHFIYLERPQGVETPDGDGYARQTGYVREQAYQGLMPGVQDYDTVGRLYEALRANLVEATRRLGEDRLFVGPVAGQIGPAVVDLEGVDTIGDLASALRAIETIVEQGEGSPGDREGSHYRSFCAIRAEYRALLAANPDFEPAWPAAENPVMRRPPDPEGMTFVEDPAAARVLDFANAVYAMLLRLIVQSFGRRPDESGASSEACMAAAIDLMHVLAQAAGALARMPAGAAAPGVNAGVSFTVLRSVNPFFTGRAEHQLISERMKELVGAARVAERANGALSGTAAQMTRIAAALDPASS